MTPTAPGDTWWETPPMFTRSIRGTLAGTVVLLLSVGAAADTTLYVDDDAPAGGDGVTWNTAYTYISAVS